MRTSPLRRLAGRPKLSNNVAMRGDATSVFSARPARRECGGAQNGERSTGLRHTHAHTHRPQALSVVGVVIATWRFSTFGATHKADEGFIVACGRADQRIAVMVAAIAV